MNYIIILVCGVLAMVLGMIWYGPLFGKKWMEVIGVNPNDILDPVKKKEMQKQAMPLYLVQFVLVLVQVFAMSSFFTLSLMANPFMVFIPILFMFLGFVVPTLASASMWTNDSRRIAWMRFLIQVGYNLVLFIIIGIIYCLYFKYLGVKYLGN